jgi:hypothetical protein
VLGVKAKPARAGAPLARRGLDPSARIRPFAPLSFAETAGPSADGLSKAQGSYEPRRNGGVTAERLDAAGPTWPPAADAGAELRRRMNYVNCGDIRIKSVI